VSTKLSTVADSAWTETGITYAGAPALGTMIGQSGALTAGTWVSFDVTAQIAGNGLVSFGLSTGSTAVRIMDSREGANPPQLVLTRRHRRRTIQPWPSSATSRVRRPTRTSTVVSATPATAT
jgi:hypothetical protein